MQTETPSDMLEKEIIQQLQTVNLFRTMTASDLKALVTSMQQEIHPLGTKLFEVGDIGDTMYIVRSGKIRIYTHDLNGREITLAHHSKNEIFGELSLIDEKPRSATALVVEPLQALSLQRKTLVKLLHERPQIGLAMMRSLSHLLRQSTLNLEEVHPENFVTPEEDHGEEYRRGATGLMASIIDGIQDDNENDADDKKNRKKQK